MGVHASDPDGTTPVQFSESHALAGAPQLLTDNGDNTATLAWTPMQADLGDWQITIQATDALGGSGSADFQLSVMDGQPPVIAPIADQMLIENTLTTLTVSATDPDGPGGIVLDSATDLRRQAISRRCWPPLATVQ